MSAKPFTLRDFVAESNRIEGIHRDPYPKEVAAHTRLLKVLPLTVEAIEGFVRSVTSGPTKEGVLGPYWMTGAPLRDKEGRDVHVGMHVPPRGGPRIRASLETLIHNSPRILSPFEWHCAYETLHPFMDGNGRSGRALWLRHMGGIDRAPLGFLHHFYYQTLDAGSR